MRRTLIVLMLVVAVVVGFSTVVQASGALQWSGGISITERTNLSGIFSRLEVSYRGKLLGCWFSNSGVLPQYFQGLDADVIGVFSGIQKIQRVELSPDHGLTKWPAELVEGKGFRVTLPDLPANPYTFEWGVWSRDKHNRLILVIIPISWSSVRKSAESFNLMVQTAPPGWWEMSEVMMFAQLRGFVSAWATPDMAVLAQEQALQNMQASALSGPECLGMGGATSTGIQVGEGQLLEEPAVEPSLVEKPWAEEYQYRLSPPQMVEVMLILVAGERQIEVPVRLDLSGVRKGTQLCFWRDEVVVLVAEVTRVIENRAIEATIPDAMQLCRGDRITLGGVR